MRKRLAVLAAGTLLASGAITTAQTGAGQRWSRLRTALFFTNGDVGTLLGTPEAREATLSYFAPLRLSKVYLEGVHQDDPTAKRLPMREIVRALRAQGLEVSGAVVPVGAHGPFCYDDPKDMEVLERRVGQMAEVVDEIIVDDWLFTTCTTAKAVAERGQQSWADYRSRLVADQSKVHLIDAAKRVNPKVQVIIKYPNWYEGHRQHGYDVALQTPQFDGVSVGIETRQRATHDQHIPLYSGYVFQRWIGGDAGPKWRSAWLDNYGMQGDDDDYVAQVYQAVLARAPEIIFWCAGQLYPTNPSSDVYSHLVETMPELDRLAGLLRGPSRGIPIHLPLGSVGEYNVFGYFGMIGLPMEPWTGFPAEPPAAIFTRHSLRDPRIGAELVDRVRAGKEVFLTWPLLHDLRDTELGRVFNVIDEGGTVSSSTFRVTEGPWQFNPVEGSRSFVFPRIQVSTWPYVRDVALVREDADFGVLLRSPYMDGQVDVLDLPDDTYDLLRLPAPVLDAIRRPFFELLGVRLLGPGGVALYPFGDHQYVLYNMSDDHASVALRLGPSAPKGGWQERLHGLALKIREVEAGRGASARRETEVALTLRPFEAAVVEAP
jgi:hypothetical protein